ncbi:MAG: hypothetical protein QM611_03845 [Microbacterium sp.]|uniref:hypothetical protein n=1 Tax=Microbacterium sp. TaxID=51671 RepID=UPI0039E37C61
MPWNQEEADRPLTGEIEKLGWRLEHKGYAFVNVSATTSIRVLGTGSGVVNHGGVAGHFTFRRVD